jgi:hypothetical protein
VTQCVQNGLPIQSACGAFFQEQRSRIEGCFVRLTGTPGTVV